MYSMTANSFPIWPQCFFSLLVTSSHGYSTSSRTVKLQAERGHSTDSKQKEAIPRWTALDALWAANVTLQYVRLSCVVRLCLERWLLFFFFGEVRSTVQCSSFCLSRAMER
ncbi:hypothetical protein VPH35_051570 [Triticum aestivum]